jgi:hypothetical protein
LSTDAFDLAARANTQRKPEDYLRDHSFRVYLWPKLWRGQTGVGNYAWTEVPFKEDSVETVPAEQGIYAFKIRIRNTIMPDHSVIVYFGQSGAGSQSNLKTRFRQYLRDRERGAKRPKFAWLFTNWPDDLIFCFSGLDWTESELRKLENDLSDAVIPVCSTLDFSARVRRIVAVLRN